MTETAAAGAESIVIVDGDADFRAALAGLFGSAGFTAIEAETGERALEICGDSSPRLVLLDVRLPGMCGYEVCRTLRARPGPPPMIVFLSDESERQILALLAAARSPSQIAAELVISPKTVATHIEHILAKLQVHSRAEAVAVAYRERLVEA